MRREAELIYRARGEDIRLFFVVLNAAAYLLAAGRFADAWSAGRESLDLALRTGDDVKTAVAIGRLTQLAAETGDAQRAARLLGYVDAVYRDTGNVEQPTERRSRDRTLELAGAALSQERIDALMAQGAALERDDAVGEAMAVVLPLR